MWLGRVGPVRTVRRTVLCTRDKVKYWYYCTEGQEKEQDPTLWAKAEWSLHLHCVQNYVAIYQNIKVSNQFFLRSKSHPCSPFWHIIYKEVQGKGRTWIGIRDLFALSTLWIEFLFLQSLNKSILLLGHLMLVLQTLIHSVFSIYLRNVFI